MSCCGNKRTASAVTKTNLATATSRPFMAARPVAEAPPMPPLPVAAPAPPSPGQGAGTVRLRYLARSAILVRGPRSGTPYRFSEQQQVQAVQRADVEPMVASGHFRRDG